MVRRNISLFSIFFFLLIYCTFVPLQGWALLFTKNTYISAKRKITKKYYASMAKQKTVSVCISNIFSFSIFFLDFQFFFSMEIFILFQSKNMSGVNMVFSFLFDHRNKKYKRKYLCKFWLFQGEQSFKFFPYFSLKTFVVRGGSI